LTPLKKWIKYYGEEGVVSKIKDILNIDGFNPEDISIDFLNKISALLPTSGSVDIGIAEQGLIITLEGQNFCQEKIALLDRYIGMLESQKDKCWSNAALVKSVPAGHKTAKDKEWFAQSDDEFISYCNKITVAKATKKWFENKASYFFGWHYTFKTFLRRDYSIEKSEVPNIPSFEIDDGPLQRKEDINVNTDDIEWG
jgi:hypothetical protein